MAIRQLKEELPLRQEHARQLRDVLKHYSWDHAAQALTSVAVQNASAPQAVQAEKGRQQITATVQGPDGKLLPAGDVRGKADQQSRVQAAAQLRTGGQTQMAEQQGNTVGGQGRATTQQAGQQATQQGNTAGGMARVAGMSSAVRRNQGEGAKPQQQGGRAQGQQAPKGSVPPQSPNHGGGRKR